jgi:hypothetical protein
MAEQDKQHQAHMKSFFAAIGTIGQDIIKQGRNELVDRAWFGRGAEPAAIKIEAPQIGGSIHESSKAEITKEGLKIYMRTKTEECRVSIPDSWQSMCADLAKARGYSPEIEQGHEKDKGMDR